jgi:Uma2 family endonuclease
MFAKSSSNHERLRSDDAEGGCEPMAFALHRLTVERYEQMAEAGFLPESGIELIDGLVVEMSPKGVRHTHAANALTEMFVDQRRGRYIVNAESLSLRLGPRDEPDPDFALVRATRSFARARATVADVALIIEVADSSLAFDLGAKAATYASAGIPEYWVIDLQSDVAHVFWEPSADGYRERRVAAAADTIAPREYPDVAVQLARVFGDTPA